MGKINDLKIIIKFENKTMQYKKAAGANRTAYQTNYAYVNHRYCTSTTYNKQFNIGEQNNDNTR